MRKELTLQAILMNNYLKVPLKKNYLVEVPYEPFKRQIINEKDSHDWICMVDDDKCLKQGAKYRTDLVTKLIETDYDMISRQKQLTQKLERQTIEATMAIQKVGNDVYLEKLFCQQRLKKEKRALVLEAIRDF